MADRLSEIEQLLADCKPACADIEHDAMRWLIAEVKRLRELAEIQRELLNVYAAGAIQ